MIIERCTEILQVNCPHCGKIANIAMRFTKFLWVFYVKDNLNDPLRQATCEHCQKVIEFKLG